jgi:glycosyltransferase involved in cell wall biosynthesis
MALVGQAIIAREFSPLNYARSLVELAQTGTPHVSVIVPNYNYARYLPARLESIFRQTYPPHEIIFLDDCSTDNSVAIATKLLRASGLSYRIIANETNEGTYRQWLRGIREATGELVWIAEADDDCDADLLRTLVAQFAHPQVILAYCQSRQIDEDGHQIAPDYLAYTEEIDDAKWRRPYVRDGAAEIADTLVVKNTIPNVSAVVMRKTDLSHIALNLIGLKNCGDWLLYVHLLEHGSIAFVPEPLNSHRRHVSSVTIGRGGMNLMRETLMVQQYVRDRHPIAADVEQCRQASVQRTYEYLGLDANGPRLYMDHDALKAVQWVVTE